MPNWKKVIVSGSSAALNSLTVTNGVTVTGSAIISGSLTVTGSLLVRDTNGKTNIDSLNRYLYDATPLPPGVPSVLSIDWGSRILKDSSGTSALAWRDRALLTSNGTTTGLSWTDNIYLSSDVYQRDYKSSATQDTVSTNYNNISSYLGDIIQVDGIHTFLDSAVVNGNLVNLRTDSKWYQVEQNNILATKLLGIAHNVDSGTGYVLLEGHVVIDTGDNPSGAYVEGAAYGSPVYIKNGTTTGEMSTTIPTTTQGTRIVRILGHCYYNSTSPDTQWIMKFRPSNDWVEI